MTESKRIDNSRIKILSCFGAKVQLKICVESWFTKNNNGHNIHFTNLFIILTERRERRVTCQQLISNIKHMWKNIVFFLVCCCDFSQGWKPLYNRVVSMLKGFFSYWNKKFIGIKQRTATGSKIRTNTDAVSFMSLIYRTQAQRKR